MICNYSPMPQFQRQNTLITVMIRDRMSIYIPEKAKRLVLTSPKKAKGWIFTSLNKLREMWLLIYNTNITQTYVLSSV